MPEGAEPAYADLDEPDSLCDAFSDAEVVYHTAGLVAIGLGGRKKLHRVNVEGTRNVIDACLRTRVRRLVYVSSIEALDLLAGRYPITENTPIHPDHTLMPYGRSKALATLEVQAAVRERDLDAVTVIPTGFIGPYDHKLSPMTSMVQDFLVGGIPAGLVGGFDFVDTRDVAIGAVAAAEKGAAGSRFLLPGHYATVREIFRELEEITGKKAPRLDIPYGLSQAWGLIAELYYAAWNKQPRYTRKSLRILSLGVTVSGQKAGTVLGYSPRSLRESLVDTVRWLGTRDDAIGETG
jgi:dihydroflavonol-4-reductase